MEYIKVILVSVASLVIGNIIWNYIKSKKKDFFRIWLKRIKLSIFPSDFNVALSIKSKEGLNSGRYFNEIRTSLLRRIEEFGLSNTIILRDLSDIKEFKSKKEAEDYRNKRQLDLIIWGRFSEDGLKIEGSVVNSLDINFTYGIPKSRNNKIGEMIFGDISSRFARRNYWQILESNSFQDIKIVSKNIYDIGIYILALTLKTTGRISESLKLFESLYKKMSLERDIVFRDLIIPHLLNCYELKILDIAINEGNYKEGENYAKSYIEIRPAEAFGYTNLALFQFKLGDQNDAGNSAKKAFDLAPKLPSSILNRAFFCLIQGNVIEAYKFYRSLSGFQIDKLNFDPIFPINFLSELYEKSSNPYFLYATGLLNFYFADKIIAKEDLTRFLETVRNKKAEMMIKHANRMIDTIH